MTINAINGTNAQVGQMGAGQATDSYSRNIQNQITNAKKQLQELSSKEDMSLEEKMKKRQEIQRQISDLNMQLRQHQMEQRKEKQQAKEASMNDMPGETKSDKAESKGSGLSKASMTAMLSADTSIKQAKVQGSVATKMEGRAGILESEIKLDTIMGKNITGKREELADVQQAAMKATASQMDSLSDANKAMKEAGAAYSVTISREGLEKLKQNTTSNTMGVEEGDKYRSILSKAQIDLAGAMEADFHHRYAKLNTEMKNSNMKAEDYAKNAFSIYDEMYDEIKRGYADGTREIYIADENEEFGYRRATEEEEIAALDAAFDFHAAYTEEYMRFVNEDKDAMHAGIQKSQDLWQAARENRNTHIVERQYKTQAEILREKVERYVGTK